MSNRKAARAGGSRTLALDNVRSFLQETLGEHWQTLQMDGDEVVARLSMDARADPRLLFDEKGKPLPPAGWPDEIANSVESFELHENGCIKRVRLVTGAMLGGAK